MTDNSKTTASSIFALTKEHFEAMAKDQRIEFVSFEELKVDGGVYVRELKAKDRDRIIRQGKVTMSDDGTRTIDLSSMPAGTSVDIILRTVCDEQGARLFNLNSKVDESTVNNLPNNVIDLIVKRVRILSGLDDEVQALDDAKND